MVFIDTNKAAVLVNPNQKNGIKLRVRCKACNKRLAVVWPGGLCIDCEIVAEKIRTNEH